MRFLATVSSNFRGYRGYSTESLPVYQKCERGWRERGRVRSASLHVSTFSFLSNIPEDGRVVYFERKMERKFLGTTVVLEKL